MGHRVIRRRGHLDDFVVLNMQRQGASDAAIWTNRVRLGLFLFIPRTVLAHRVFGGEHEGASWTYLNAISAIHTSGVGEIDTKLRRDPGIEASSGYADGKRVLPLLPTRVDALVTQNTF